MNARTLILLILIFSQSVAGIPVNGTYFEIDFGDDLGDTVTVANITVTNVTVSGGGTGSRTDLSTVYSLLEDILEELNNTNENISEIWERIELVGTTTNVSEYDEELMIYLREVLMNQSGDIRELLLAKPESGVVVGVPSISIELYPAEFTKTSIPVKNRLEKITNLSLNVMGKVVDFMTFENMSLLLEPGAERDIIIGIYIPVGTPPAHYYGEVEINMINMTTRIPVSIRVLTSKEELLNVEITPLADVIGPGEKLRIDTIINNLGETKRIDVQLLLQLIDMDTNDVVFETTKDLVVETSTTVIGELNISPTLPEKKYMVKGIAKYNINGDVRTSQDVKYIPVTRSFFSVTLFGIPVWLMFVIFVTGAVAFVGYVVYKKEKAKKKRYLEQIDIGTLPQAGSRSGFIGKIAETDIRAFTDIDRLSTHVLVAGATGSGKTIAAQVIAEEALKLGASVIVFDPTAQWSGFLRPNKDGGMFRLYPMFNMKDSDAQAFKGNIHIIGDSNKKIGLAKYIKAGEITIFSLHKLDTSETDTVVENTIKEVFAENLEESNELKVVFIYDEVHRLLPKFGGSGKGFTQIERAVREFRKWGVGLVLISQVLSDFVGEIKANVGTEIQMRTRYEGDLDRIKMKYGEDILRSVVKASIGTGMIQNAQYNRGRPYFVSFRPLFHSMARLVDKVLDRYSKYNQETGELEDKISTLKNAGVDVFDLELELKLTQDNIEKGSFDVVKLYLESLVPRVAEEFSKIDIKKKKIVTSKESLLNKLKARRDERNNKWDKLKNGDEKEE